MESEKREEQKQEILKWLKQFERLPTSRFMGLLGTHIDNVKILLKELEEEKKIKKVEETNSTYWELK